MVSQPARRPICTPTSEIRADVHGATIALHPSDRVGLTASYFLDYGLRSPIARQCFTMDVRPESFLNDVADLKRDANRSRQMSLRESPILDED